MPMRGIDLGDCVTEVPYRPVALARDELSAANGRILFSGRDRQ
jgi:hypothetical protein